MRWTIDARDAGKRLDKLVAQRCGGLARRRVTELFAEGAVRVAARLAKKGERALVGALVSVDLSPDGLSADPTTPLAVRWESPHFIVVSKPAGQPSVALRGSKLTSLAAVLAGRYPELRTLKPWFEAGLVHRLDSQTSGLLIAAKTQRAYAALRAIMSAGQIVKRYLALVSGTDLPDSGIIDLGLKPRPRRTREVQTCPKDTPGAYPARTEWRVVRRAVRGILVEATVHRAYRHQIRAHFAALGFPILGDALYGGKYLEELGARHALHASYVAWGGNAEFEGFEVCDALPSELARLLEE
ncbi:MAG TPA: RluA family pseudouridine synthase [Polyangiaceae bacterium]|jgi:23S rRNA pseudouridine1911/1915/1917 synthase